MIFSAPYIGWLVVGQLRQAGPGGLLVWSERHDGIVPISADGQVSEASTTNLLAAPGVRDDIERKQKAGAPYLDEELLVIAAHHDLEQLEEEVEDSGAAAEHPEMTDGAVGAELSQRAAQLLQTWPRLKALTGMVAGLRAELAGHGLHLAGPATVGECEGTAFITEEFRTFPCGGHRVRIRVPFAWEGPVEVVAGVAETYRHAEEMCPKWRIDLEVATAYPGQAGAVVAAAAAGAAARLSPRS